MKKFIILSLIALVITALHANGACLLKDLKKEQSCSGGASQIPDKNLIDKKITKQKAPHQKQNKQKNYADRNEQPTLNTN